jgi:hypothetical protein
VFAGARVVQELLIFAARLPPLSFDELPNLAANADEDFQQIFIGSRISG